MKIKYIVILLIIFIFITLSFKKVFTSDTLIPNLEPYPDTLYYSIPAWNFVQGNGFVIKIQDTIIKQQTPPLLGIYLIPFFAVFDDIRSFYFANIILHILTLILFINIIDKIFSGTKLFKFFLLSFLGFFLASNFYFYTIPQLLMAESLTLFLITLGIYLYVSKHNNINTFFSSQIGILLILVKLANIYYAIFFFVLFFIKYFFEDKNRQFIKSYLVYSVAGFSILTSYLFLSQIITDHKNLANSDISITNLLSGVKIYTNTLLEKSEIRYLWYTEKLLPQFLVILSIIGTFVGLIYSKIKKYPFVLILLIFTIIISASLFKVQDLRFILGILPPLLILIGFFFQYISSSPKKSIVYIFMISFVLLSLFSKSQGYKKNEISLLTFKKQVGLNFRHREVSWNYEAVQTFNKFTNNTDPTNTYIATFLPSPFVEAYSNNKYNVLPIDSGQEFYWLDANLLKEIVDNNISDYIKKLITSGKNVYITHYYKNNLPETWPNKINDLISNFSVEKVYSGCLGSCDLYQISVKN